jgi:hypothetical protein
MHERLETARKGLQEVTDDLNQLGQLQGQVERLQKQVAAKVLERVVGPVSGEVVVPVAGDDEDSYECVGYGYGAAMPPVPWPADDTLTLNMKKSMTEGGEDCDTEVLQFGKLKGSTFAEAAADMDYTKWMLQNEGKLRNPQALRLMVYIHSRWELIRGQSLQKRA